MCTYVSGYFDFCKRRKWICEARRISYTKNTFFIRFKRGPSMFSLKFLPVSMLTNYSRGINVANLLQPVDEYNEYFCLILHWCYEFTTLHSQSNNTEKLWSKIVISDTTLWRCNVQIFLEDTWWCIYQEIFRILHLVIFPWRRFAQK